MEFIPTMSTLQFNASFNMRPAVLLRLEGVTLFAAAVALYIHLGGSALLFAALLFAPDLTMLGYLAGPTLGARLYNLTHTITIPALLLVFGLTVAMPTLVLVALVGLAHIGMDRFLGYGLKYTTAFKDTHLQRL